MVYQHFHSSILKRRLSPYLLVYQCSLPCSKEEANLNVSRSESHQIDQNGVVSNQLTGRWKMCVGGVSESVDARQGGFRYCTMNTVNKVLYIRWCLYLNLPIP